MRVLIQRVSEANVTVSGRIVGQIGKGFALLVGVTHSDTTKEADWLVNKIAGLRIFEDDAGKMNLSLEDVGGELLIVSQFTLYGNADKGRRPSFIAAARPEQSEPLYDYFVTQFREHGFKVGTGVFGAEMLVNIQNDGPVTLMLEKEAVSS